MSNLSILFQEIYRKKLQQCVADGELDENDVAALLRVRVMLCVPQQTVDAAHSDICGSLFEKVKWFLLGFNICYYYMKIIQILAGKLKS